MTEIIISIAMPLIFILMAVSQIKKTEEVAIQKGGKTFISSKTRLYVCSAVFLVLLIASYIVIWTVQWGLGLAVISPGVILFMMAVTSYCSVSDTHLHVSQTVKIGTIASLETEEKGEKYIVTIRYDQQEIRQTFDKDSYEHIKGVKARLKEMRKK